MLRAVIFDFDFTLADSSAGVVECINYALTRLGYARVSKERSSATIGLSLPDTFAVLTGERDPALAARFTYLFVDHADQIMTPRTYLFEVVQRTMDRLREMGLVLGIVSTKYRYRIEEILGREGLLDRFDVIVGGKDVAEHKPDPSGLALAMDRLDVSRGETVYVGDHVVDAETAARAGVTFVAVLTGTCDEAAFDGYPVLAFLEHVGETVDLLRGDPLADAVPNPSLGDR